MNAYMTIKETALMWGISTRRVQILCNEGRVNGAEKNGRIWRIPRYVAKPADGRITTGEYRNWRKFSPSV